MARRFPPVGLPPVGQVDLLTRARLATEIIGSYPGLSRAIRGNDLRAMAASARDVIVTRGGTAEPNASATARRLGLMVTEVLGVLPTDRRCLITSLVLVRLLARRGISARVVIGVAADERFAAHAWVEHEGVPVLRTGTYERLLEV